MKGICLDAGALIAVERQVDRVVALIGNELRLGRAVDIPAGVLAQVWRGGPRQARLAKFVNSTGVKVIALEDQDARAIGVMCGFIGATDVIDAHVAWHARAQGLAVLTSDPDDIARFGPLEIIAI